MQKTEDFRTIVGLMERVEGVLAEADTVERHAVLSLLQTRSVTAISNVVAQEIRAFRESLLAALQDRLVPTSPQPPPTSEQPKYLTERQAAAHLNVSVGMLRKWRVKDKGPKHVRIGRLVRYPSGDLDAFLD